MRFCWIKREELVSPLFFLERSDLPMRSTKRPRRPVHRYRSLLFPAIALLAVFAFWAAFGPD